MEARVEEALVARRPTQNKSPSKRERERERERKEKRW